MIVLEVDSKLRERNETVWCQDRRHLVYQQGEKLEHRYQLLSRWRRFESR